MKILISIFTLSLSFLFFNPSFSQDKKWSDAGKNAFLEKCFTGGKKEMGNIISWNYCSCMLDKLMSDFKDEQAALKVSEKWMTKNAKKCLKAAKSVKGKWSMEQQTAFVKSCANSVGTDLGIDAEGYCTCMLEKTMEKYPDVNDAAKMDQEWLKKEAKRCVQVFTK